MKFRFTRKAAHQLAAIRAYIARDNVVAAQQVARKIRRAATLLTQFPRSGRIGSVPGTREWVVHGLPYIIVYRDDDASEDLMVIEIVHGARRRPGVGD